MIPLLLLLLPAAPAPAQRHLPPRPAIVSAAGIQPGFYEAIWGGSLFCLELNQDGTLINWFDDRPKRGFWAWDPRRRHLFIMEMSNKDGTKWQVYDLLLDNELFAIDLPTGHEIQFFRRSKP